MKKRVLGFAALGAIAFASFVASAQDLPPLPPADDGGVKIEYVQDGGVPPETVEALRPFTPPPPNAEEEAAKRYDPSGRVEGGFQYAQLSGVPFSGARVRGGVGVQSTTNAQYATVTFFYGETEGGLRTWDIRVGWTGDLWRWEMVRVGADVEFGYLTIHRATDSSHLWALGLTGGGHVSADLYKWGPRGMEHGIYVEGRFDVLAEFGISVAWSPSALAGFRY
jgi:hypothetical protein